MKNSKKMSEVEQFKNDCKEIRERNERKFKKEMESLGEYFQTDEFAKEIKEEENRDLPFWAKICNKFF